MSKYHHLSSKLWRLFSLTISAILVVGLVTPINTMTAYALTAPQPIYPENYAITTSENFPPLGVPTFTWSVVEGANLYHLQVARESNFILPVFLDITTRNTSYTPQSTGQLFTDGEWFWRVRVDDPVSNWSPSMHFTKTWANSVNKPSLLAPDEGFTLAFFDDEIFDDPVFSWTRVTGAAKYRIQIAESSDKFNTPLLSIDTLAISHQPNNKLINGTYFWRVIPIDPADHLGTPSDIRSFSLAYGTYEMDQVPTLLEPADESFPTFTPSFSWTPVIGAGYYHLEYTSDENCDFSVGVHLTLVDTHQTFYTPTGTFPNDFRYCWRVRVQSDPIAGDWSDTWHFQKKWYLQPVLLTPNNGFQNALYPVYTWTPVPGAASYNIEISTNPSFSQIVDSSTTANTTYSAQALYYGSAEYWWRVTPIDGGGNWGLTSLVSSFRSKYTSTAPILIYPQYYYPPNDPIYYLGYPMDPVEDRTVAFPIFIWHRVMVPAPVGGVYASAYRIQVDTTPYFNDIVWEYDTENTSASPIDSDDFDPMLEQDYYWRVCVLDHIGGSCVDDPSSGWSQTWKARFDPSLALTPTDGNAPELLRPAHELEITEATPLLEWWPYQEITQTQYLVEISRNADFSSIEISETVNIPAYSPSYSIAQRSLGRTNYGTLYWRVQGLVDGVWSDWSNTCVGCEPWRFQIASQSEWRAGRTPGLPANRLLIGVDELGETDPNYDLTTLYVSQSDNAWYFGFTSTLTTTDMTYVFYIDLDHVDGSGAPAPPERNYIVTTIPAHQPEYAIYVDQKSGVVNAENTWIFPWNGSVWDFGKTLSYWDGSIYTSTGYVELRLPYTSIGMEQTTSSASIMLFSVNPSTNLVEDTVPADPNVPGSAELSRFSAVSERINLIFPPSTVAGDPATFSSVLPFYWDWPTGSNPATPFNGGRIEVHLDSKYTNRIADLGISSNTSYFSYNHSGLTSDLRGDNIYYWRIQPRYYDIPGAWTGGSSFRRIGLIAQNLQTSVTFSTPTFSWDRVEGAATYHLQVSTYPNFGSNVIDVTTAAISYTPPETMDQQYDYYWRVQIYRYGGVENDWSEVQLLHFTPLTPTGLTPNGVTVPFAPTFCWDPPLDEHGNPVLIAWKFYLQVSQDTNFINIYDQIDTVNNCWTPTKGYDDGPYYWRVAMIDGNNRMGSYSAPATFVKEYPITSLISPISGPFPVTPTFIWTPVDGAASYRFEISLTHTFDSLYDSTDTISTEYTPTWIYTRNQVYYWRVAIRDRDGKLGDWVDASVFIGAGNRILLPLIKR